MVVSVKQIKDYKLAHQYLLGDKVAGQELYAAIFPLLQRFIYTHPHTKTFSDADKEDVFSNTLKTSIEKLELFNGQSSFSTFVCGIAKFKILEKIKESKRETDKKDNIVELAETTCIYDDPLTILVDKELRGAIAEAQRKLSPDHLQVMQLRLNGMKAKDVAKLAQMSEDAVNSMFYRAIKAFKDNFKNIYYK
jgi:RNA polymerase sigma factor (sigma-70 family)